ncbi:sugar ABC transporter permease [Paenibacillus psychroresistens]|uniref:Sugar ABC transporter permease n=1 Tax=Paenibacillus psychroresistens TaxID=1778678 RepID=A0A6B8RG63_9BACL|nr:ABC transporter permease subunit [Paenibacillus psychroresistens]QGQ95170.1 sugar ABC transporter permease [Paenibacillus psychroresistens]
MSSRSNNGWLYLMLLPAVILTFVFSYLPIGGLVMAFQDYQPWLGFTKSPWVGLEQFRTIFEFPDAVQVIWNTVFIAAFKIIAGLFVPFFFALLLNEVRVQSFKRSVQTLVYLPHFLSWVVLGGILVDVLSPSGGILNRFLGVIGIEPIFFLGNGNWFRATVIISDVWKEFGFSTIVYLAALAGINPSLYEAAESDGASRFQQTVHVTIPSLIPIMIVLGTLSLGSILNAGFDQIFNLYSSLVYSKGDIIDTYVYRMGIQSGQLSFGAAFGFFKSVISTLLIVFSYRMAYKYGNYKIF